MEHRHFKVEETSEIWYKMLSKCIALGLHYFPHSLKLS